RAERADPARCRHDPQPLRRRLESFGRVDDERTTEGRSADHLQLVETGAYGCSLGVDLQLAGWQLGIVTVHGQHAGAIDARGHRATVLERPLHGSGPRELA